jgi:hypothetical protein
LIEFNQISFSTFPPKLGQNRHRRTSNSEPGIILKQTAFGECLENSFSANIEKNLMNFAQSMLGRQNSCQPLNHQFDSWIYGTLTVLQKGFWSMLPQKVVKTLVFA